MAVLALMTTIFFFLKAVLDNFSFEAEEEDMIRVTATLVGPAFEEEILRMSGQASIHETKIKWAKNTISQGIYLYCCTYVGRIASVHWIRRFTAVFTAQRKLSSCKVGIRDANQATAAPFPRKLTSQETPWRYNTVMMLCGCRCSDCCPSRANCIGGKVRKTLDPGCHVSKEKWGGGEGTTHQIHRGGESRESEELVI